MAPRKRLGQLLTELGVIDEHQLQSALGHQKQWGGKLGGILVQKGFCSEDAVVSALTKHLGMQRVKIAEVKVDPRALKCVSKQIAEKLHVLPYEMSGSGRSEVVTMAMSDPTDLSAVDQLAFHTGKRIKPMLAGDGEIIAAIQAHYGSSEDKKEPTDKVPRPAAAGPPTVTPGAPAGSVAGFPRRIEPPAGPAAATAAAGRAAPYIPPPIPAAKPALAGQKLEEIEPDSGVAPRAPRSPARPEPVDLPEVDEGDFGLEPIAAHSQFGDEVAGQEEVAGDGTAADAVEGLVSASVAHAGWGDAPDPAAGPTGWTGPIQSVASRRPGPTGRTGPIESASPGATGWTGPIDLTAADGWGEPAAPAASPDAWSAPPAESADGAEPASDPAWGVPESDQVRESSREALALPTDAILGALQESPSEAAAAESQWGDDAHSVPAAPSEETDRGAANDPGPDAHPHEAEAPDAWASSDDPLAAEGAPADPLASQAGFDDPLASDGSANAPSWAEPANEPDPLVQRGHSTTQEFANPSGENELAAAADPDAQESSPDWRGQASEESPTSQPGDGFGESSDAFTPLSEADLGTLASIGVEPSDGMGALRLLAALVRILNRGQHIEPHELRAEIHESLAQGTMTAASVPPTGLESEVSSSGDEGVPTETAET
jgi:type II secretion system (T2SS) protein E